MKWMCQTWFIAGYLMMAISVVSAETRVALVGSSRAGIGDAIIA